MIREGEGLIAWFITLFFGLCLSVFLYVIVRPGTLELGPEDFTQTLFGRKMTCRWEDVSNFGTYSLMHGFFKTNTFVSFDRLEDEGKTITSINRKIAGASAQLGDSFGMKADELVILMERFRQRAIGEVTSEDK